MRFQLDAPLAAGRQQAAAGGRRKAAGAFVPVPETNQQKPTIDSGSPEKKQTAPREP